MDFLTGKWNIIVNAADFLDLVKEIIEFKKKCSANFSQNALSMKLGFKSKAYLSSILNQRRIFPQDKIETFCQIFKFTYQEQYLTMLLYQLAYEKSDDKLQTEKKINNVRQHIRTMHYLNSTPIASSSIACELFFVFLRLKSKVKLEEISRYFSHYKQSDVNKALEGLLSANILAQVENHLILNPEFCHHLELRKDMNDFIRKSFQSSSLAARHWFQNSKESIFGFTLVGCTQQELNLSIHGLNKLCEEFIATVEDLESPDTVFRLNMALYPVGKKKNSE